MDPAAGRVRFDEFADQWRHRQVHRPSTELVVESHLRNHVYPTLGARPLAAIRQSEIQALVKDLSDQLAPRTIEVIYRYIVSIFRSAVTDRVITTSPCTKVRLPKIEPARVEPLTVDQVWALSAAMPARYQAPIITAAGTGMRQGECLGLTLDRIDFLRRRLTVDRQLLLLVGKPPEHAPPKTAASYRTLPLPNVVLDALASHLAKYPPPADGLVFTNDAGKPIRRNRLSDLLRTAVDHAEVPPDARFHDLRHHYASLLIRHGESVKTVQARLGHASASETLDTYAHPWPDSEDRTREAVDLALGQAQDLAEHLRTGTDQE